MNNLRNKLYRFMYGRYGVDEFGKALSSFLIVLCIISIFFRYRILNIIIWITLIYSIFRMFSKNIVARRLENDRYIKVTKPYKLQWQYRKTHKIFRCKNCGQIIRVPKHRGVLEVTCPKCRNVMTKRT